MPRLAANVANTAVWEWNQHEPFVLNVSDENPSSLGVFRLRIRS